MKKISKPYREIPPAKVTWEERPDESEELNGIWWQGKPARASKPFGKLVFILIIENYKVGQKKCLNP